jgi:hypothetical protein
MVQAFCGNANACSMFVTSAHLGSAPQAVHCAGPHHSSGCTTMDHIIEVPASDDETQHVRKRPRWAKGLLRPPLPPPLPGVNPIDLFLDIVEAMPGFVLGTWISWEMVLAQVREHGFTEEMALTAFENWWSLEVMEGFHDPSLEYVRVVSEVVEALHGPDLVHHHQVCLRAQDEQVLRDIERDLESAPVPGPVEGEGDVIEEFDDEAEGAGQEVAALPARQPAPTKWGRCDTCGRAMHVAVNSKGEPFLGCNGYKHKPRMCMYAKSFPPEWRDKLPRFWATKVKVDF